MVVDDGVGETSIIRSEGVEQYPLSRGVQERSGNLFPLSNRTMHLFAEYGLLLPFWVHSDDTLESLLPSC
jgi:hypothetical protein